MNSREITEKVKKLNLPRGQYIVFGSCPLAVAGIREANDIDLFVSSDLFRQLKMLGWEELYKSENDTPITHDCFEAHENWNFSSYNPTLESLLKNSKEYEGVDFASLEDVLRWKKASGRQKDLMDSKLIEQFLYDNNQIV